jgi:transmembrane sensor
MSAPSLLSRSEIEHQASLWAARLENDALGAAERQQLDLWLRADPEHRHVLSRYRELSAALTAQVPVLMERSEVEAVVARAAKVNRLRRALAPALAAAAAVALAGAFWWMQPERVETTSGERRTLALADGSRVELNARTGLEVDFSRGARRVKLLRGEALFQVAHDSARPFLVETGQGVVRVTGTVFNVRETAVSTLEVTLLEGSVQLTAAHLPERPAALTPNDQAVVNPEAIAVQALSAEEARNAIAWRSGQAAFVDAPLREALARFAPYHPGTIAVDGSAAALRVGGRYSLDDLDGFLAALEQALPVNVLRGEGGAVRVVARPEASR